MSMHSRHVLAVVLAVAMGMGLAGCWDSRDPRNRAFVTAIGFDLAEDGELEVTFQIPAAGQLRGSAGGSAGGSGGQQRQVAFTTVTGKAKDFAEAFADAQASVSRELYLGQVNLMVFGRRLAEKGLRPLILELARTPEAVTCFFAMSDNAREALAQASSVEPLPGVYIRSFFESVEINGRFLQTRLWKLYRSLITPGRDGVMPVMQTVNGETRITGTAVLKGDRLAAILDHKETRGLVWLLSRVRGEALTIKVGERSFALRQVRAKSKTKVYWAGNRPIARASISISGEISAPWSELDSDTLTEVEVALNKYVQEEVKTVLTRVQEAESDPVGFGARLLEADPLRWRKLKWDQEYSRLQPDVSVRSRIYGTGMRK